MMILGAGPSTERVKGQPQMTTSPKQRDEWADMMMAHVETAEKVTREMNAEKKKFVQSQYGRAEYLKALDKSKMEKESARMQDEQLRKQADVDLQAYAKQHELT